MNKKDGKLRDFWRMFIYTKPYWPTYLPGLILYCSQMFIFPFFMSLVDSRITAAILASDVRGVVFAAIMFIGLFIAGMLFVAPGIYVYTIAEGKAIRDLKTQLFRRFVKTSVEKSMAAHSGEGIAAINTDADMAASLFGNALASFLFALIPIIFSALVIFLIDYRLGFASIGIGLLALFIQTRFAKPMGRYGTERLTANASSVKAVSNIFSGAVTIRAFNAQDRAVLSFDRDNGKMKVISFKLAFLNMWQSFFTTIQGWLSLTGVFALGGYLVATKQISFVTLMMAPSMCAALANGMSSIGSAWAAMQAPLAACKRVFAILDGDGEDAHKTAATEIPWNGGYDIKLDNLDFTYMNAETPALTGVTLNIKENQMVAFVGESGSGKSTLLRAIIGMFERDDMDISLGNADIRRTALTDWRKRFAYVDQSCKLFDMTISENIGLGGDNSTAEDIRSAAVRAYADGFISQLQDGYDTPCGEKGASLSGGQKQRIAIARALVRHATVLVFDEATSALDAESERQVMETIGNLRKDHTVLITSHNLSNIADADLIVVLDKGKIAETGTHGELMERRGVYWKMVNER